MPQLIVIGTSLGGLTALPVLLQTLSPALSTPIAIVQHRHRDSRSGLLDFLQPYTTLSLREVEDKDPIQPRTIYLAPADYHLLVESHQFALSIDEPVSFARPSIDVLFETAAESFGKEAIGVILTGANQDGAQGAATLKAQGGTVIIQDPTTAESPIMPAAVQANTSVDWVLPLTQIGSCLNHLCLATRKSRSS
ncbi:MAG: chemotaxis protein CheB [Elainella sp. Prado103]|jgi:two-component system chemotaxis response regulator CheB|nr:chemotaxis protein CheB [Elainella sp. Prado103]